MPQARVNLPRAPSAQLGVAAAPKAELDVRAPTAEVHGPKVDVGAKVGQLVGDIFGGGGKHKGGHAELNVQAPNVNVNAPKLETSGGMSLGAKAPALDVSARGARPQVQLGAPQVNVGGPQVGFDASVPKPVLSVGAPAVSAPALNAGASARTVKLDAAPPAMNAGAAPAANIGASGTLPKAQVSVKPPGVNLGTELKGAAADLNRGMKNVGAEVSGLTGKLFGGAKPEVSAPKAGVDLQGAKLGGQIQTPKADIQAPKVELEGQAPKLELGARPPVVKVGATAAAPAVNVGATAPGVRVVPASQAASASVSLPAVKKPAPGVNIGADLKGAAAGVERGLKHAGAEVGGLFGKVKALGAGAGTQAAVDVSAPKAGVVLSGPKLDVGATATAPKPELSAGGSVPAPKAQVAVSGAGAQVGSTGAGIQMAGPTFHKPDISGLGAGVKIPGAQV